MLQPYSKIDDIKIELPRIPRARKLDNCIHFTVFKAGGKKISGDCIQNNSNGIEIHSVELFEMNSIEGLSHNFCKTHGKPDITVFPRCRFFSCCIFLNIYELKKIIVDSRYLHLLSTSTIILLNNIKNINNLLKEIRKYKYKDIYIGLFEYNIVKTTIIKTIEDIKKRKRKTKVKPLIIE